MILSGALRRVMWAVGLLTSLLLSVPAIAGTPALTFVGGWVGEYSSAINQPVNMYAFDNGNPDLNIQSVTISQNSSTNQFELQGNDIPVTITVNFVNGTRRTVQGAVNWRETTGSTLRGIGLRIDQSLTDGYPLTSGRQKTYLLKVPGSTLSISNGGSVSGNAALSAVLTALNEYLAATPNFTVSKSAAASVVEGSSLAYTIGIGNSGGGASGTSVTIQDALPSGASFVSVSAGTRVSSVSCTQSGQNVNCTAALTSGLPAYSSTGTASITINTTAPTSGNSVTNYVSVDPNGGTNPPPARDCNSATCANASTTLTGTGKISGTFVNSSGAAVSGATVNLLNSSDTVLASTTTSATGAYQFTSLRSGTYGIRFVSNGAIKGKAKTNSGNASGEYIRSISVSTGGNITDADAVVIDPAGVVYNSTTRSAVAGAVVKFIYNNALVSNSWLDQTLGGPNTQTTGADGQYSFVLNSSAQSGTYTIQVEPPAGYSFQSTAIAPSKAINDPYDPGLGGGVVAIQSQSVAPTGTQATTYYLSFGFTIGQTAETTSNGVINNHIPIDPVRTVTIANTTNGAEPLDANGTGTNGVMTVSLSSASSTDTVISYEVSGTATADTDYTALSGTVTIPANQTTATISIPVLYDDVPDPGETVIVTLKAVTSGAAELSSDSTQTKAINTIRDNQSDNPPVFTNTNSFDQNNAASYSFSYAENTASGTTLGTVSADPEGAKFSITGGNTSGWFTINSSTGAISLTTAGAASAANDYEQSPNSHTLTVKAEDANNSSLSTTIEVKLNETNVNDNAPAFTNTNAKDANNADSYSFDYAENSAVGATLGTVSASDIDGDTPTFSITGGDTSGWYTINSSTGAISLTAAGAASAANDYEQSANSHTLTVTASDGTNSTTIEVKLNETNVNESAPSFTNTNATDANSAPSYSFNYAENTASGVTLGTVSATDPDGDTLTFSITGGNSNGWYTINTSTGAISLTANGASSLANDYERTPNTQTLTVTVSDGTNSTTIEVRLNETNVSDLAPAFTNTNATDANNAASYSFDYPENSASGATLGTVSASDPDGAALTFSITGGNANGWFAINASTGAISLTQSGASSVANDYEQSPNSQTLTVSVSNGSSSTTIQVKLNETDGDETAPVISGPSNGNASTLEIAVNENQTQVTRLTANEPVTWSIGGGNDSAKFEIKSDGTILFLAPPDFENPTDSDKNNTYILTVIATDASGNVSIRTITVTVLDLDDAAPVITGPSGGSGAAASEIAVNENQTQVTRLTANEPVTWSISGGNDAGKFEIREDGTILFLVAPDFERPTDADTNNTYILTITATDASGNVSTQTITVTVLDLDDVAPVITGPSGGAGAGASAISITEGLTIVTTFTANEAVTWSIDGGSDAGALRIDAKSGTLSFVAAPDFEAPTDSDRNNTYVVRIRAADVASNVSYQTLTITVLDLDEIGQRLALISEKLRTSLRGYAVRGLTDMLSFNEALTRAGNDNACNDAIAAKNLSGAINANQTGGQVQMDYNRQISSCERRNQVFADLGLAYSKVNGESTSRMFASLRLERGLTADLTLGATLLASRSSQELSGFASSSISDESLQLNLYSRYRLNENLRTGAFVGYGRGWYHFSLNESDGFLVEGKMTGDRQVYGWMLSGDIKLGSTVITTDAIVSHAKEKLGSAGLSARYRGESRSGIAFDVGTVDTTRISVPVTAPIHISGNDEVGSSTRLLLSPGLLCEDMDAESSTLKCGYQLGARLVAQLGTRSRIYADYRLESVESYRRSLVSVGYARRFGRVDGLELAVDANRGIAGVSGHDNRAMLVVRLAH